MSKDPTSVQDHEAPPKGAVRDDRHSQIIRRELDRRIALLEETDDAVFGRFTALDWAVCSICFFLLPLLIAWWAA
jgi:hypothetical protein